MENAEPEEKQNHDESKRHEEYDMFHRQVELPAHRFFRRVGAFEFLDGESGCLSYDAARLDRKSVV